MSVLNPTSSVDAVFSQDAREVIASAFHAIFREEVLGDPEAPETNLEVVQYIMDLPYLHDSRYEEANMLICEAIVSESINEYWVQKDISRFTKLRGE